MEATLHPGDLMPTRPMTFTLALLALLALLTLAPTVASAQDCSVYPGESAFSFESSWRGSGPKGMLIAETFAAAWDPRLESVGFSQRPAGQGDIRVHGYVNATIRRMSESEGPGRDHAEGPSGPGYTCTASYSARVAFSGTAVLALNLRGSYSAEVAGDDDEALTWCVHQLAERGVGDGRAIRDQIRAVFEQERFIVRVVVAGLPDYGAARALAASLEGVPCVQSVAMERYIAGSGGATQHYRLRTGVIAARLLTDIRAAAPQVRLTLGGHDRIFGEWAAPPSAAQPTAEE